MYLTEKAQKAIKWFAYITQVILIALVITFGAMTAARGRVINERNMQVIALTEKVDSLKRVNAALGAEDVFTVNVNFNLTQKNVLSFSANNCQNIAKDVATMTRQELYDSLYAKRMNDDGTVQQR